MKKLVALLAAVALSMVGLVAFSAGTAQAQDCPYTGCIQTHTSISGPSKVKRGTAPKIRVAVTANSNAQPKGKLKVKVTNNAGFRWVTIVHYSGPRSVQLPTLKRRGLYTVKVVYKPGSNSPFRSSSASKTIRVTR